MKYNYEQEIEYSGDIKQAMTQLNAVMKSGK